MSVRSAVARSIDWRDPTVVALGLVLAVNLALLSSAVRDGSLADVSMSLGICYGVVVVIIGVSRGLTGRDLLGIAFTGGIALFAAIAFALSLTFRYAAIAVAFGACLLWQQMRTA